MILAILNILDNILDALNRMLTAKEPVRMEELTRSMWQGLETYWRAEAALMDFRPATASGAPESM